MKKSILASVLVLGMSASVNADTILGLHLGADYWQGDASGSFGTAGTNSSFDYKDNAQPNFYVALEHPIPLVPNVMLRSNDLQVDGNTQLSNDFQFGGQLFGAGTSVTTELDLSHTDVIMYYEIFDNDLVSIDLGLNVKYLNSDIDVSGLQGITGAESLSALVPMGYGRLQVGVPLTGWFGFGEISALELNDDSITDYQVGLEYEFIDNIAVDAALRLGYRSITVDIENLDNVTADVEFDGFFAGLKVHF